MNHRIPFSMLLAAGVLGAGVAAAQSSSVPAQKPAGGMSQGGPQSGQQGGQPGGRQGGPAEQALSAEQLAKVKAVLAPYQPGNLTAESAKAIKRALRDAGLRPGRALGDALRAAGFDPRRLEELAPRPDHPPRDGGGQSGAQGGQGNNPRPGGGNSQPGIAPKY